MSVTPYASPAPASTDWVPLYNLAGGGLSIPYSTRVYQTANVSIPHATWTKLSFNTVRYDRGGQWSSGQPTRLTCQASGTYYVQGSGQFQPVAGGTNRLLAIYKNGVANIVGLGGMTGPTMANAYSSCALSQLIDLVAGDYIELLAYQDSGGPVTLNGGDANNWHQCDFAMALVSGPQGPPGTGIPYPVTNGLPLQAVGGAAVWAGTGYGTTLPASPADGQEYVLVDSVTNPSYSWRFRYNAGSSSAYKWEFIGGTPMRGAGGSMTLGTSQTSAIDVTGGPVLALPRAGIYRWVFGGTAYNAGTFTGAYLTYLQVFNGAAAVGQTANLQYHASTYAGAAIASDGEGTFPSVPTLNIKTWMDRSGNNTGVGNCFLQVTPVKVS